MGARWRAKSAISRLVTDRASRASPAATTRTAVTSSAAVASFSRKPLAPALTWPWLWPGRPSHDLGAALCAGLVFAAGLAVVTLRGARDRLGDGA